MFDSLRENFEIILVVLFTISTLAYIYYRLTFYREIKAALLASKKQMRHMDRKGRKNNKLLIIDAAVNTTVRKWVYFFADLFWVLLFVVVIRSFLYEPFIIPSGSMKPGLQVGDIVLVNKYELGLRAPVSNARLTHGRAVARGDVIVFKFPKDPKISFIKRVIGLPGDKVYYDNRNLIINGSPVVLKKVGAETDIDEVNTSQGVQEREHSYTVYDETLPPGRTHTLRYADSYRANYPPRDWVVPEGQYLVMGDNRDHSADGRDFGYMDDRFLIGRAKRIAFNFDCLKGDGKCDRFFKVIE